MIPYAHKHWETVKSNIDYADIAFVAIRVVALWGVAGWVIFSPVTLETAAYMTSLIVFFGIYSIFIYILLFFLPDRKRIVYGFSLFFDFLFTTLLIKTTGGFDSSFSNAFYLMTAIYSFYFGPVTGFIIAALAMGLYFVSGNFDFSALYWTDFSVRVAFLFLLAIPLGMLSNKLKKDREDIEILHGKLEEQIERAKDGLRES
jgi:hypothetical protein